MTLFPWIEENQGFLSLLALVVALAVAVFEYVRVLNGSREEQDRDIEVAIDLVNRVELARIHVENMHRSGQGFQAGPVLLQANRVANMLGATVAARPHSTNYALALQMAVEHLEALNGHASQTPHQALSLIREEINRARAAIVAVKRSSRSRRLIDLLRRFSKPKPPPR
jgi:hypothetical protein